MELLFIIPAVGWLVFATLLQNVSSLPFSRFRARPVSGSAARAPVGMADLIDEAAAELRALGFEGPRSSWLMDQTNSEASQRHQTAWVHPDCGIVVYLLPPENQDHPSQLNTILLSRLKDGRLLISQAFDPFFAIGSNQLVQGRAIAGDSLAEQLERHRQWADEQDAPLDRTLARSRLIDELLAGALNQQRAELINQGLLVESSDGVARPGLRFALRMLRAWIRRPKMPASNDVLPLERLLLMDRVLNRVRGYAPTKAMQWMLFGGSVVAFLLLGSLVFDPVFALLIAIVIAFHELGHFLAMRAFGYRQVRMMLLPMIGGVTIGYEEKPDPVRRGWVSLMGPLPGIVAGAGLLWGLASGLLDPYSMPAWVSTLAWLLLVINYLNLLPIPPLDGGRIVEDLLPARWAWLRVLVVACLCGVGIAASVLMGFWLLALIIALPLLAIPGFLTAARAARLVDGAVLARQDRSQRMRVALEALETVAGPTKQVAPRLGLAEEVLRIVRFGPVGLGRQVSLGIVYSAVLLAPLGTSAAALFLWFTFAFDYSEFDDGGSAEVRENLQLELESQSSNTVLARYLDGRDPDERVAPASIEALETTEQHLGLLLPKALRQLYLQNNGLSELGVGALEALTKAPDCLLPVFDHYAELQQAHGAEADLIYVDDQDHRVRPEQLADWLCLGPVDPDYLYVAAVASAGAAKVAGHGLLVFTDYGIEAYPDLDSMLRSWVLSREMGTWRQAHYQHRRSQLEQDLQNLSTTELLDRSPTPGFLQRRALGLPAVPGPARASDLAAAEDRFGRALPRELGQLYARHNGYWPWGVVPVEDIQHFTAWPGGPKHFLSSQHDQAPWELDSHENESRISVDLNELDRCLAIGKSSSAFMAFGNEPRPPTLFWCPDLDGGLALDFQRRVYHGSLHDLFVVKTAELLMVP